MRRCRNEEPEEERTRTGFADDESDEAKLALGQDDELEQLVKDGEKELFALNKEIRSLSPERLKRNEEIAALAWSDNKDDVCLAKKYAIQDCSAYVESLVRFMLGHFKTGNIVDVEDCVQDVYVHLCRAIREYNPKYSLLTFVRPKIVRAIQEARSTNSGISPYYMANAKPINEAIVRLAEKGIMNPSEKDIHIMTGLPMKTIVNTRGQIHASQERRIEDSPYDALDSAMGAADNSTMYTSSPESIFMSNENNTLVYQALNQLSDLEKNIVIQRGAYQINWQTVALTNGKEPEEVKRIYAESLKKLRMSKILSPIKYGNKGNRSQLDSREIAIVPIEQATRILDDIDDIDMTGCDAFEDIPDDDIAIEEPDFFIDVPPKPEKKSSAKQKKCRKMAAV